MLFNISKKVLLLLSLWTGIFCNYACYSIIAPFFPQLARKKGLSAEHYSFVFGVYSLSQITFSIIVGRSLTKVGAKFIVISGLFVTGGSTILFGCLERSSGGPIFFWLCMAVRAVEGAGFAAYLTSALAVLVRTFPTNPGYYVDYTFLKQKSSAPSWEIDLMHLFSMVRCIKLQGLTETIVTVAMISGPPLGSFLYTIGGYSCPFISFGAVIIIMSIASYFLIEEEKSNDWQDLIGKHKQPESLSLREYREILKLPAGSMVLVSVTCNVMADAFILIALSEHLTQFKLEPMIVGSIYLCLFLSYGISSPLSGHIADKMGGEFLLQGGGCLIMTVAFILVGPASFLEMKPKVGLIIAGLLLKGLGAGPLISCSYSAALRAARRSGLPEEFRTYSLVSTLISFSIPLGNLLGGFTTGFMTEKLGMRISTTLYGAVFLFLAAVCFFIHILEYYLIKKQREIKYLRLKQNWLRGEDMPLIKKPGQKMQVNGKTFQNEEPRNHCAVPLQITEIDEKKCNQNSKLEYVEENQEKNVDLT